MDNDEVTRDEGEKEKDKKKASHQGNEFFRDDSETDEAGGGADRDEI